MRVELRQLEQYLDQTLGVTVTLSPWRDGKRLAPYLRDLYSFWETRLLGAPCLLMVDAGEPEQAASVIRKHMTQVQAKWPADVVYVRGRLTPYNRKRLVEQKVPFVVPGNQMYLPMLGVDFREHFRRLLAVPASFSPATQAMVIYWLLKVADERLTPAKMARWLGYSAMTMTRAFNELEAAGLGAVARHGKERHLGFAGSKRDVWAKAQPFLRSPITKRLCVRGPQPAPEGIQAGLAALAHYTMLAPPAHPVIAFYGQDREWLPLWHNKTSIPSQDPDALEVEVWSYKPGLFAKEGVVDRLSLYLSLKDNEDERVQAELEDLVGEARMVRGLDIFRERFRDFSDRYVLIGGTACDLAMGEAGLEFRATKDLDIVLCVESLDKAFAEAFWAFVREGDYQVQERAEGDKQFYRFQKPKSDRYPFMLELFSRVPDALTVAPGSHLTPIPTAEEVSSLSAILMDVDYYRFVRSTTRILGGLPVVGPEGLIPLKARAWLDLTARRTDGDAVDSRDIRKHKNDVFRLYQIVDPESMLEIPGKVKADMASFITQVASEGVDLKALGMPKANLESILADLGKLYRIG